MPGEFVSINGTWVPDIMAYFEGGKIAKRHLSNPKVMNAVIRVKGGEYTTVKEALGAPVAFTGADGKQLVGEGPDPAALAQIRKTMQDENALAMPIVPHPSDVKPQPVIVVGQTDKAQEAKIEAQAKELAELREIVNGLKKADLVGVPQSARK